MPPLSPAAKILLIGGRIAWAVGFVLCAYPLAYIAFDTQVKNGPYDQYWAIFPGLGAMGIVFLAPFLTLLRGQIPFRPVSVAAILLALGASTLFSTKEFALTPYRLADGSAMAYALGNLPIYAFIFGCGALLCWFLTIGGRAISRRAP